MEPSACRMPPLLSRIHSLQLWHLLLVVLAVPPPATWSLRSRGPAAPRPLCTRRSPSAPRSICIWERTSQPERDSRSDSRSESRPAAPRQRALPARGAELRHVVRLRRQAAGARPATPSGFEDGMPSSQYPWAIVWGPTVSDEDGGDTNSANPGFPPLGYTFVSPHGMATAQPNSHSLLHNAGLNLRETPATLRPFLFGPRGEGVDPQLYVTITISIIIVLVATGIIFKFCWDRNQKRRRHSGQQSSGRQQESQQPLTDLSPTTVSILGPYGDPLTPTPEAEQSRQGQEGAEKLGGHGIEEMRTQLEVLKQQVQIYEEDFRKERSDRERLNEEKEALQKINERLQSQLSKLSSQTKELPVQPERPSYPAPLFLPPCVTYGGCGMVLHCPDPRAHPAPRRAQKQQQQCSPDYQWYVPDQLPPDVQHKANDSSLEKGAHR